MSKKVNFAAKPSSRVESAEADKWVESRTAPPATPEETEELKRLTLDIPFTLHRRIKTACAKEGVKMRDAIQALLEQKYQAE